MYLLSCWANCCKCPCINNSVSHTHKLNSFYLERVCFLGECDYTLRSTKVVVSSSAYVEHSSSPVNSSRDPQPDNQAPYVLLDPLAGTVSSGTGGSSGRQLRQHKTSRTGGERLQNESALTSLSTSRMIPTNQRLESCRCVLTALTCLILESRLHWTNYQQWLVGKVAQRSARHVLHGLGPSWQQYDECYVIHNDCYCDWYMWHLLMTSSMMSSTISLAM